MTNNDNSVKNFLSTLDGETLQDSQALIKMMHAISDNEPAIWNEHTLGFDTYHYKYDSGREGDSFVVGFYPRKGKVTVYLMDGTARYAGLLDKLGKHTVTGYCVVIKRLADIELLVLEQILQQSYGNIKSLSKAGPINRILWQTEK